MTRRRVRSIAFAAHVPIYEYRCPNGHTFEVFQRMCDAPAETCVTCGAGPVEKLLFPVAVHFKGSGFYSTDYGRGRKSKAKDGDSVVERAEKSTDKPAEKSPDDRASRTRSPPPDSEQLAPRTAQSPRATWRRRACPSAAAAAPSVPRNIEIDGDVVLGAEDHRLAADRAGLAAEPAVERRAGSERKRTQPSWTSCQRRESVASGAASPSPMNGRRRNVPKLAILLRRRLRAPAAAGARGRGRSGRVELVLADARVDERAPAVHVLLPLLEPPAVPVVRSASALRTGSRTDSRGSASARRPRSRRPRRSAP